MKDKNPIPGFIDQIQHSYTCPITLCIMEDPVITSHGRVYERVAIAAWFQIHPADPITSEALPNMRDPITGAEIPDRPDTTLRPDGDLQRAIHAFLESHEALRAYVHDQEQLSARLQEVEEDYYYNSSYYKRCSIL